MDVGRVIKGLQCIIDGTVRCESCGYSIDKHGHHSCQQNCASDAIVLLKEQEPKAVLHINDGYYCPRCSTIATRTMGVQEIRLGTKYCPYCGQAVILE